MRRRTWLGGKHAFARVVNRGRERISFGVRDLEFLLYDRLRNFSPLHRIAKYPCKNIDLRGLSDRYGPPPVTGSVAQMAERAACSEIIFISRQFHPIRCRLHADCASLHLDQGSHRRQHRALGHPRFGACLRRYAPRLEPRRPAMTKMSSSSSASARALSLSSASGSLCTSEAKP